MVLYFKTNAAIPWAASQCASSKPSESYSRYRNAPPGATMTAEPFATPLLGNTGNNVASETLNTLRFPLDITHSSVSDSVEPTTFNGMASASCGGGIDTHAGTKEVATRCGTCASGD